MFAEEGIEECGAIPGGVDGGDIGLAALIDQNGFFGGDG